MVCNFVVVAVVAALQLAVVALQLEVAVLPQGDCRYHKLLHRQLRRQAQDPIPSHYHHLDSIHHCGGRHDANLQMQKWIFIYTDGQHMETSIGSGV